MTMRRVACALAVFGVLGVCSVQAGAQTQPENSFTTATKHVITVHRVDLPDAAAGACGLPASAAVLVDETSDELEPTVETITTFGPATVYIGEDQQTPYQVGDDETNFNTITTYETVVTRTYQGAGAGAACPAPIAPAAAVVTSVRLTG
jgi:hypothetical protein